MNKFYTILFFYLFIAVTQEIQYIVSWYRSEYWPKHSDMPKVPSKRVYNVVMSLIIISKILVSPIMFPGHMYRWFNPKKDKE